MKALVLLSLLLDFAPIEEWGFEELEESHQTVFFDQLIPKSVTTKELLNSVQSFVKKDYRIIDQGDLRYYCSKTKPCYIESLHTYDSYVRPGSTVIDYKAGKGIQSLLLARLTGEEGRLVAFEEVAGDYRELFWNFSLNNLDNSQLYPYYPGSKRKSLDELNLTNVSFIRVNMDRDETSFFQGAVKTILRDKPYLVIKILGGVPTEWTDKYLKQALHNQLDYVRSLGYTTVQIADKEHLAYFP